MEFVEVGVNLEKKIINVINVKIKLLNANALTRQTLNGFRDIHKNKTTQPKKTIMMRNNKEISRLLKMKIVVKDIHSVIRNVKIKSRIS